MLTPLVIALFSLFLFVGQVEAFWRLPCSRAVLKARMDPIVGPLNGKPTSHAHTFSMTNSILRWHRKTDAIPFSGRRQYQLLTLTREQAFIDRH